MRETKKITLIITRNNGADGVALQMNEYIHLLHSLDYTIKIITGCDESTMFGNPLKHLYSIEQVVVPELSLYNPDRTKLFDGQFKGSGISRDDWINEFDQDVKKLHKRLSSEINDQEPVIIYNLLAYSMQHPAAALVLNNIIKENPNQRFISFGPDPNSERKKVLNNVHAWALDEYCCFQDSENLDHIVLNPKQKSNLEKIIKKGRVFEIPDFLDVGEKLELKTKADDGFLDKLNEKWLVGYERDNKIFQNADIDKDTVYFISPVRTVARKRLKQAMDYVKSYGEKTRKKTAFIVTHPDIDGPQYHKEVVKHAYNIRITYLYTGDVWTHNYYENFLENMAALNSIGVVASSAGGFENAILEMAAKGIPVVMSSILNSYPIVNELGFNIYGMSFNHSSDPDLMENELYGLINYTESALDINKRREIQDMNYKLVLDNFSQKTTINKLKQLLNEV